MGEAVRAKKSPSDKWSAASTGKIQEVLVDDDGGFQGYKVLFFDSNLSSVVKPQYVKHFGKGRPLKESAKKSTQESMQVILLSRKMPHSFCHLVQGDPSGWSKPPFDFDLEGFIVLPGR